ncbi:MAG: hypothetical protein M3400_13355 [Actinomycetota bacterium]|nr:hypothetical protein [Actinomycetota bacterium]
MRTLATALSLHKPASRLLRATAIILLCSAAIHGCGLLALDGQWAGPVSLRKPITFGLSIGLLLWTLGWVIDRLSPRPRLERVLGITLAGSGLLEVALITVQAWRGVPSHFNYTTVEDTIVFVAMGLSIAVLSMGLLVTTVWTFVAPPSDRTLRLAVRAGMILILSGLGIGQWIIELGNDFFEQFDRVPDTVVAGAAGAPTFPHAMGFHGIQVFVLAALITSFLGVEVRAAQRVLRLVVAGYSVLLVWSVVQAAGGAAPLDLLRPSTLLAVIGLGLLAASAVLLLIGWRRRAAPDPQHAAVSRDTAGTEALAMTAVPSAR